MGVSWVLVTAAALSMAWAGAARQASPAPSLGRLANLVQVAGRVEPVVLRDFSLAGRPAALQASSVLNALDKAKLEILLERAQEAQASVDVSAGPLAGTEAAALPMLEPLREALAGVTAQDLKTMPLERLDDFSRTVLESVEGRSKRGAAAAAPSAPSPRAAAPRATPSGLRPVSKTSLPQRAQPPMPPALDGGVRDFVPMEDARRGYAFVSVTRALFRHALEGWNGRNVFRAPAASSDHWVLTALSAAVPAVFVAALLSNPTSAFLLLYPFVDGLVPAVVFFSLALWSYFGYGLFVNVKAHLRKSLMGRAVVRNARRYALDPAAARWDGKLMRLVEKFERQTGWRVALTDDPHLFFEVQEAARRVIISAGWVLASADPRDLDRIPYLTEYLGRIAAALEGGRRAEAARKSGDKRWLSPSLRRILSR